MCIIIFCVVGLDVCIIYCFLGRVADGVKVHSKTALARYFCARYSLVASKTWMFSKWSESRIRHFARYWLDTMVFYFGVWHDDGMCDFVHFRFAPTTRFRGELHTFTDFASDEKMPKAILPMCRFLRDIKPEN